MYVCMYVRTVDVYIGNEHDMFTWILDQIPRRQQEYSFRFIPYSSSFPSHTPCLISLRLTLSSWYLLSFSTLPLYPLAPSLLFLSHARLTHHTPRPYPLLLVPPLALLISSLPFPHSPLLSSSLFFPSFPLLSLS
jgi:hypothetical protein